LGQQWLVICLIKLLIYGDFTVKDQQILFKLDSNGDFRQILHPISTLPPWDVVRCLLQVWGIRAIMHLVGLRRPGPLDVQNLPGLWIKMDQVTLETASACISQSWVSQLLDGFYTKNRHKQTFPLVNVYKKRTGKIHHAM
jgi:hypothetical protein